MTRNRYRSVLVATVAVLVGAGLQVSVGSSAPAATTNADSYESSSTTKQWRVSSVPGACPCTVGKPHRTVTFSRDAGARPGVVTVWKKPSLILPGWAAFQAEFHSRGQWLKLHDYKADGDALYVTLHNGDGVERGPYRVPSGQRSTAIKMSWINDDQFVLMRIYDGWDHADNEGTAQLSHWGFWS